MRTSNPFCDSTRYTQHSQRGNEWHDPQTRDRETIQHSNCAADNNTGGKRAGGWPSCVDSEGRDYSGQRNRRPDGEINSTADDDDRHADRAHGNDDRLRQNGTQVLQGDISFRITDENREYSDYQKQTKQWTKPIDPDSRQVSAQNCPV